MTLLVLNAIGPDLFVLCVVLVHCLLLVSINTKKAIASFFITLAATAITVFLLSSIYEYGIVNVSALRSYANAVGFLFILLYSLPFVLSAMTIQTLKKYNKSKNYSFALGVLAGGVPLLPFYPASVINILFLLATCNAAGDCV